MTGFFRRRILFSLATRASLYVRLSKEKDDENKSCALGGYCLCNGRCTRVCRKAAQGLQLHPGRQLWNERRPGGDRARPWLCQAGQFEQHAHLAELSGIRERPPRFHRSTTELHSHVEADGLLDDADFVEWKQSESGHAQARVPPAGRCLREGNRRGNQG